MNRLKSFCLSFLPILLFSAGVAFPQTTVYMLIDGLEGPLEDGSFELIEFDQNIYRPYDPDTYELTGPRHYDPIRIVKELDSASPILTQYLATSTRIPKIEFVFTRFISAREKEIYYRIIVENAVLVSMTTIQPDNKNPDTAGLPHMESIELVFENITFSDPIGGHEYKDLPFKQQNVGKSTALTGVMYVWDAEGKPIPGPLKDSGFYFYEYSSTLGLPYDPRTGKPLSERRLGFGMVQKELNGFSSLFVEYLNQEILFSKVQFSFLRPAVTGGQETFYEIILDKALLVSDSVHVNSGTDLNREYLTFSAERWTWRDLVGKNEYTSEDASGYIADKADHLKGTFHLYSFPNPFNATTRIYFRIPEAFRNSQVNVSIYDSNGRLVNELYNDLTLSEDNIISWDATTRDQQPLTSGAYFYRVSAGGAAETGKLLLIK